MELTQPASSALPALTDNVRREVLPNGLTVLIKENHNAPVVALYLNTQIGYFNEPDKWNGIAHVIEHMMFKGTPTRPEKEQIATEVKNLGGYVNAGTYYEETSYYIVVPSQHLAEAMDIQADMVQNTQIDAEELAKEIEVIVQESLQKRDNPGAMLTESLYALAYDAHRIRRWRIGHPETLRGFRREDLQQFIDASYRPENLVLSIVGDVNTQETLALAQKLWGEMPQGEFQRENSPVEPARKGFRYERMTGETKQRLFNMAFPAPDVLHEDAAPLMVLSALLSDGRSARLYRKLKEELQIANSAWASYEGFLDMGVFTLGGECVGDDPLPVLQALWSEIERIKSEPVAAEELKRIKTRVETRRLTAQEEVMGVARTLASYEAIGDYRLSDTMLRRLRDVTAEDIQRVANVYLRLSQASLLEYLPADSPAPEHTTEEIERTLSALSLSASENVSAAAPVRAAHPEAKSIALPGGGTLLYKRRDDLPLIAITAAFKGGKCNESRLTCGLTNLMLKSSLKGTEKYSAEEIANRIEGLGSGIGFSAAPDFLSYSIKLKRDTLAEGFAIFREVLARPAFPADEVEREKQAIYAEIRRQQDSNASLAIDQFSAACYGEHPYGLPSSGIAAAVADQNAESVRKWHDALLRQDNLTVAVVGDVSEDEAMALFANLLSANNAETTLPPLEPPVLQPFGERIVQHNKQQTAAALGFPGANLFSEDRYALDMLSEIASGMGGRFFRTVRGDNALAYQVSAFHRSRQFSGNFIAYTSTAPENETLGPRTSACRNRPGSEREPVSDAELAAAKAALLGEHIIGTQTFSAQSSELAVCGVYGLGTEEPQRYLERIQAVTAEDIQAVAGRYLDPVHFWLGAARGGGE